MISDTIKAMQSGKPVLIFDSDDREGETDITIPSQFITPEIIKMMRKDGGGLICTTIRNEEAKKIKLPYLEDLYKKCLDIDEYILDASDMKYDKNSTFSITINSRKTFTGIPDNDRSRTVKDFSNYIENIIMKKNNAPFGKLFRTPGHIHLLIASRDYFNTRRGHTELSTFLVESAGLIPSATIVETLGENGKSLPMEDAMDFAKRNSLEFITGDEIVSYWRGLD